MTYPRVYRPAAVAVAAALAAGCSDEPAPKLTTPAATEGKTADPKFLKGAGRGDAGGGRMPKG